MDNDFTVTSAYITAIAAIIAPAITALIHSVKEYKIYSFVSFSPILILTVNMVRRESDLL